MSDGLVQIARMTSLGHSLTIALTDVGRAAARTAEHLAYLAHVSLHDLDGPAGPCRWCEDPDLPPPASRRS